VPEVDLLQSGSAMQMGYLLIDDKFFESWPFRIITVKVNLLNRVLRIFRVSTLGFSLFFSKNANRASMLAVDL